MIASCIPELIAYLSHTCVSGSTSMSLILSSVAMSNSLAEELNSGGLPAATSTHPSGMRCGPNFLFWRRSSIAADSVSETQLTSSMNSMPSLTPWSSIASYTEATISLMVYLVMGISTPPKLLVSIIGRPMADWRVWCVMV